VSLKRYTDKYDFYRSISINFSKSIEIGEELVQEMYIILMDKDPKLLKRLADQNKAESYCIGILKTSLFKKNSDFYKKEMQWRKNRSESSLKDSIQEPFNEIDFVKMVDIEKLDLLIKRLPFFEREVFRVYYDQSLSLNKFAKQSGISRKTLYNTINKVKKHIKENYK